MRLNKSRETGWKQVIKNENSNIEGEALTCLHVVIFTWKLLE